MEIKLNEIIDKSIYNVYTELKRDDNMEVKIQKWGNSDGIRIPSNILKSLNLKTNDKVELIQENDKIIITKLNKKHLSFEERVANFKEEGKVEDYDWGEARGKELW